MKDRLADRRIRLLLVIFLLLFAAVFARAAWLQVVEASTLSAQAQSQHRATDTKWVRRSRSRG